MNCTLGNDMLKAWSVMLCFVNCMYTTCYEWQDITINEMKYNPLELCMIWELKNEKRYDMNVKR